MNNCSAGPRYCPKCGKELEGHISVCVFCGCQIEKEKLRRIRFPNFKEVPDLVDKDIGKQRIKIGLIIFMISLLLMIIMNIQIYYIDFIVVPYLIYVIPLNIIGLGLIYFTLNPKIKGFFLTTFGFMLFGFSFLTTPSFLNISYYEPITTIGLAIFFIDIPIAFLIISGLLTIYREDYLFNKIGFLVLIFSSFLPYILFFATLGY